LENSFGHNFGSIAGEQLWGAALGSSFEEQLCTAALKNCSFGEHLGGVALERNLGEQFSAATLGSSFPQLWGNSFGEQLWAQLWGAAPGNSFVEQL